MRVLLVLLLAAVVVPSARAAPLEGWDQTLEPGETATFTVPMMRSCEAAPMGPQDFDIWFEAPDFLQFEGDGVAQFPPCVGQTQQIDLEWSVTAGKDAPIVNATVSFHAQARQPIPGMPEANEARTDLTVSIGPGSEPSGGPGLDRPSPAPWIAILVGLVVLVSVRRNVSP